MRGYKAKVLRRIAKALHPGEPMYGYANVEYHQKMYHHTDGAMYPFRVTGQIVRIDKQRKLYKSMKKELTHGITR